MGLPEHFPAFETPCGYMFTGKVRLIGDDSARFKNLVLPSVPASMSELLDIWQQKAWVLRTSPLTNLLESITWVTVPDIYLHSTLLKKRAIFIHFPIASPLSISQWIKCLCSSPWGLFSNALSSLLSASLHSVSSSGATPSLQLLSQVKPSLYRSHRLSDCPPLPQTWSSSHVISQHLGLPVVGLSK